VHQASHNPREHSLSADVILRWQGLDTVCVPAYLCRGWGGLRGWGESYRLDIVFPHSLHKVGGPHKVVPAAKCPHEFQPLFPL